MEKIIYTSFPCLVRCGGQEEFLTVNEHLIIDSDQPISVYPAGKDRLAFDINLESPSPFYRVISQQGRTLIFLPGGLFAENIVCKDFNYSGIKSRVEVGTRSITFLGKSDKKIVHLSLQPKNVEVGNFLFINYVLFSDDNGQTLIAYNPKKNTARIFNADKIEIQKEGFTLYKAPYSYKDIIERYYVDGEGLKVLDKTFSNVESAAALETLPYKFMTAIKCCDYNGCLQMLSPTLSQKLNEQALKQYFGEISYFYMLDALSCFAISDNQNIIYEFTLSHDKISDITDKQG